MRSRFSAGKIGRRAWQRDFRQSIFGNISRPGDGSTDAVRRQGCEGRGRLQYCQSISVGGGIHEAHLHRACRQADWRCLSVDAPPHPHGAGMIDN